MKPNHNKLKVAILGCGQIADAHLSQIARLDVAEVVAVCDVHDDLAYQAAKRFGITQTFTNMHEMVEQAQPDVVHITTPAQTHTNLAIDLLKRGCHVYVEKPFTLDAVEAAEVIAVSAATGRQICVGHDQLFDPIWLKCKEWIQQGLLGEVKHIESVLGYPISGQFGALVNGNPNHWVRQLPGGLFQNTISHPLYRITDLLKDTQPAIQGDWSQLSDFDFPTELQLGFQGQSQSASLTFSTRIPPQRITRVYGTKGHLALDFDAQTLQWNPIPKLPGAFAKLEVPWKHLKNAFWNMGHNAARFAKGEIHYFQGMKNLCEQFYLSILNGTELPISPEEIYRVTYLMDRIFDHCRSREVYSEVGLHPTKVKGGEQCLELSQ